MIKVRAVSLLRGAVACAYVLSLSACCSTHALRFDPEPKKMVMQIPENIFFNIETVSFVAPTNVAAGNLSDFGVIYLTDNERRAKVMRKAEEVYPKLFSDKAGAIPLNVTITRSACKDHTGAGVCVSCLTLTIYPIAISDSLEYTVEVKTARQDINQRLSAPVTFTRDDEGRMSCFPTGLIPCFGAKGKKGWSDSDELCESMMLDSSVHAIASALQRVSLDSWSASQK